MRFVAEPISDLRLQRFHRWAMLWLKWFAAFLEQAGAWAPLSRQAQTACHIWLDRIECIIIRIVVVRAVRYVRRLPQRKGAAEHRHSAGSLPRAVIGSKLRRALRPKDLRQRIEALTQSIGSLVGILLRRLPRGLTRRRPIKARREPCAPALSHETCWANALLCDTS
jgi:hypothetical protein